MRQPAKQPDVDPSAAAAAPDDEQTIFRPAVGGSLPVEAVPAPASGRTGLPPGTLLNNIYAVRRFIARGGMGEVYEGTNVNTDERVAIKVMLPHLAADPKVQAMFRKEARILTELAHPALVRYRVLAHEPQLELFYIVTEFIDGPSLAEQLDALRPSDAELAALVRRLAGGLAAAHALGAVHRDISPDNVLLPEGRLDLAKIIDFGIAREGSLAHQTVVGDGFAGKLGYVAPEQLGDFGARVGPWTDVYSLGLVGLTLAAGRAPDLGSSLVDAVDRRREAVDLSAVPESLRPAFQKMLAANPAERLQTMDAVIAALAPADSPIRVTESAPPEPAGTNPGPARNIQVRTALSAAAAALVVVSLAFLLSGAPKEKAGPLVMAPIAAADAVPLADTVAAPQPEALNPEPAPESVTSATVPAASPKSPSAASGRKEAATASTAVSVAAPTPQPVETVAPTPTTTAEEPTETAPQGATEACWRADGGAWTYIGYASRGGCVAQVFSSCPVVHGRWGKTQLRRYDGKLQAKGTAVLAKWRTVGASECASTAAAQ